MLRRKAYAELLSWKAQPKHKCMMIKGARQVGKTYLVREFGSKEYKSFLEINFIKQPELKKIFQGNLSSEEILKQISLQVNHFTFVPGNTLIFLDEIQNCGRARTAVKFMVEDGRYDIITSGSLLGLTYAEDGDKDVEEPESVPTGYEDFLTMYSLDFEEFLWAEGCQESTIDILKDYYERRTNVPDDVNEKYETLFREFMVVGGMPEVVSRYVEDHDFNEVSRLQNRIIEDYRADITKHAKNTEKTKVRQCYESVPVQLAKELKKFQYATVEKGKTAKKYGDSIQWLVDSALVHKCTNTHEGRIPLAANIVGEQFKLYVNDTGLLCAMYGFEAKRAVINNTISGNVKGGIYENAIAESLIKKGYRLYYWKPDEKRELEFVIEKDGEVLPLEVKAGNNATVSLNSFIRVYHPSVAYKLIGGNLGYADSKLTIPHYMVMFI